MKVQILPCCSLAKDESSTRVSTPLTSSRGSISRGPDHSREHYMCTVRRVERQPTQSPLAADNDDERSVLQSRRTGRTFSSRTIPWKIGRWKIHIRKCADAARSSASHTQTVMMGEGGRWLAVPGPPARYGKVRFTCKINFPWLKWTHNNRRSTLRDGLTSLIPRVEERRSS